MISGPFSWTQPVVTLTVRRKSSYKDLSPIKIIKKPIRSSILSFNKKLRIKNNNQNILKWEMNSLEWRKRGEGRKL
jgi:hypothetical protein